MRGYIRGQVSFLGPTGSVGAKFYGTTSLVLHDIGLRQRFASMGNSCTRRVTESLARGLLSIIRLNSAITLVLDTSWSRGFQVETFSGDGLLESMGGLSPAGN